MLRRMVEGSRGYLGRECRGDMLDRWIEMLMELNAWDWRKMEDGEGKGRFFSSINDFWNSFKIEFFSSLKMYIYKFCFMHT